MKNSARVWSRGCGNSINQNPLILRDQEHCLVFKVVNKTQAWNKADSLMMINGGPTQYRITNTVWGISRSWIYIFYYDLMEPKILICIWHNDKKVEKVKSARHVFCHFRAFLHYLNSLWHCVKCQQARVLYLQVFCKEDKWGYLLQKFCKRWKFKISQINGVT